MSHFEAIFDEPEFEGPGEPIDTSQVKFTTYRAALVRDGKWWTATVRDLPNGGVVVAQGSTWAEVHRNTHAAVISSLGVEPYAVGINLVTDDSEVEDALHAVVAARVARGEAEEAERAAVRHAAQLLTGKGWSTRDAGGALNLSHQRISQLAPRASA
ncbi:hypothetical protein [Actinocorallia aurea]